MKILVYGAGAMGLYFAATLTKNKHAVYLKARKQWNATNEITVHKPGETNQTIQLAQVFEHLPHKLDVDLVIIATKAWQVHEVVKDCQRKIPSSAIILTFQNGISAPENVVEVLQENPVVASTCVVIVKREEPGTVSLLGHEAKIVIGDFTEETGQDYLSKVSKAFEGTPIDIQKTEDIHRALWKKLSLIASYGGVGAVSHLSVGQTRSHATTRSLVYRAIKECAEVARAYSIDFTDQDIEDTFAIYTEGFDSATTSSMQRDLAEGKPSELDDQVGEIVRRAQSVEVHTPTQDFLYQALKAREEIARSGE
ncbi:2-dehydropantoate 2-reductase [uncultured Rothia sp.]|uniref:ketopantoate reductase family protein n=1 Tax=uncultured Rothia sp. TaxID=316088 RepID=UPI0032169470